MRMQRPTIQQLLDEGTGILESSDILEASLDARLLLEHVLQCDHIRLILNKSEQVCEEKSNLFLKYISERKEGRPLQYILGFQEFMGLNFLVNKNTLIPRRETEELVELALNLAGNQDDFVVIDLGTGSGCIPISLCHYNKNIKCIAIDFSEAALRTARENAIMNKVENRITFIHSDLFVALEGKNFLADMIISNPPYIKTSDISTLMLEVKNNEPLLALDGGVDGLDFYRRISEMSMDFMKDNGHLLYEIGYDQGCAVIDILKRFGYKDITLKKDLSGNDRIVFSKK